MSLKDSVTSQNAETREELNGKIAELQIELSRNRQEMDKKLQLIFDQFQEYYAMSKDLKQQIDLTKQKGKLDEEQKSLEIKNLQKKILIDKKVLQEEIVTASKQMDTQISQLKEMQATAIKKINSRLEKDAVKLVQDLDQVKEHSWDEMKKYVDSKVE